MLVRPFAIVVACLFAMSASAADWPRWGRTVAGNAVSDEKNLPDNFVPIKTNAEKSSAADPGIAVNVRWVAPLGGASYGNPVVADGRVYVGTDDKSVEEDPRFTRTQGGLLKCFDEKTGKLLWQLVVPKRTGFPKSYHYSYQHLGVCSSPIIDGDRLYVVTSAAEVLCLDVRGQADGNAGPYTDEAKYMTGDKPPVTLGATDADIIWRYDLMTEVNVVPHDATACSVLVHGDAVYLSTSNGVDHPHTAMVNPNAPALIALDKRTGKLVGLENEKISTRIFHCQWSPPTLGKVGDKNLLFFGGADGICYAFEPLESLAGIDKPVSLKKVWSFDCNPPEYKLKDGKPIPYIKGDKRKKDSWNKNDGSYVGPSEIIGTPVFHNGRVYVAIGQDPLHGRGRGLLHCIDASKTGDITQTGRIWSYDGLDRTIASPTIADGLIYIPDIAGRIHCVDAETGKPYWVHATGAETWGSVLAADGKLYLGTVKDFYIFAAGKEEKLLNRVRLGSGMYNTPIAANGALFIASSRHLWAVEKGK